MKKFTLKFAILLFVAIGFSGCEPAEDITPSSSCTFTEAESKAYYDLAMKFANSPTSSNCSSLKTASYNLIKKFEKCDAATKAQIAQLTQSWNNINCSDF